MSEPRILRPDGLVAWLRSRGARRLQVDSRKIEAGDAFIAWPGAAVDGRRFIRDAFARGAVACVMEAEGCASFVPSWDHPGLGAVHGLKQACGELAAQWFDHPSQRFPVLAWTGTNGKTSSVWWMAHAMAQLQPSRKCGVIGTLGVGLPGQLSYTGLTTPDPFVLQGTLSVLQQQGAAACAMEASSIGIVEGRLDGVRLDVAVLTNFTQDHLDYHGTMEAYAQAKRALFDWPGLRCAVLNADDALARSWVEPLRAQQLDVWTFSMQPGQAARLRALDPSYSDQGVSCLLQEEGASEPVRLHAPVLGHYNLSNLLGVIAALRTQGIALADAAQACRTLAPVPGRLQCEVQPGKPMAVVDYAHTPDAVEQVLRALRPVARQRGGRLWCVLGCGGDRDPVKRPLMAAAAQRLADQVILTSDNPRSEDPEAILDAMEAGVAHDLIPVGRVSDRATAIRCALQEAHPEDVVLIAGKGHEDYQEIAGVRHPFSDLVQARDVLAGRKAIE